MEIVNQDALLVCTKIDVRSCFNVYIFTGCYCKDTLEPVCGMDGKNYENPCFADCRGAVIACKGQCPCRPIGRYL